jgi:hypothetical protein
VPDECTEDFKPDNKDSSELFVQGKFDNEFSPFGLFLVGISKEDDFLLLWEYQPETPLDAIEPLIIIGGIQFPHLVIFNRDCPLEVNSSCCSLGHVVECDKIRTNDSQLAPTPCLPMNKIKSYFKLVAI